MGVGDSEAAPVAQTLLETALRSARWAGGAKVRSLFCSGARACFGEVRFSQFHLHGYREIGAELGELALVRDVTSVPERE